MAHPGSTPPMLELETAEPASGKPRLRSGLAGTGDAGGRRNPGAADRGRAAAARGDGHVGSEVPTFGRAAISGDTLASLQRGCSRAGPGRIPPPWTTTSRHTKSMPPAKVGWKRRAP